MRVCVSHSVDIGDSNHRTFEPCSVLGGSVLETSFPLPFARVLCGSQRERGSREGARRSERAREQLSWCSLHDFTTTRRIHPRHAARLTSSNVYIHLGRDIHCPPPAFAPFACLVCWILLGWTSPVSGLRCACCVSRKKMSGKVEARSEEARKRQGRHARNGTTK